MSRESRSGLEDLRRRAEELLSSGRVPSPRFTGARLEHEFALQSLELELQNQALREGQRELQDSRAEYRDLFDSAPLPYVVVGRDRRIKKANLAAGALFGKEPNDLVGIPLAQFVAPEEAGGFERHRRNVVASDTRVRARFTTLCKGGALRPVLYESSRAGAVAGEWRTILLELADRGSIDEPRRAAAGVRAETPRDLERACFHHALPPNLAIVVVTDDTAKGTTIADHFRTMGLEAFAVFDGFDALELLKSNGDRAVVVVADSEMRSLGRPEFAVAARAIVPTVHIARSHIRSGAAGSMTTSSIDFDGLHAAILSALADSRRTT